VSARILYRRTEAAEMLAMSLDHFERFAQPHMRVVRSGRLRLIPADEIERWARERAEFAG
jgi:excisionase family DNA binding protein